MVKNSQIVDFLIALKIIDLERAHILDVNPTPLPSTLKWDKIEGMLLGLAIGDALGNTTESKTPQERYKRHRRIKGYLPNLRADRKRIGMPSDDTQMAFWTISSMLEYENYDYDLLQSGALSRMFAMRDVYHGGKTVREFKQAHEEGKHWLMCGQPSAGNGAIMRIAPIILPYLKHPSKELWADTILASIITHNDRASTGSCLALMHILWKILKGHNHGDDWFVKEFCRVLKCFEGRDTCYAQRTEPFNYCGPLYKYVQNHTFDVPLRKMKSGAYMLETMPAIMCILTKWWGDPERAILEAVNSTKDNDTIASIVATVMGAIYGKDAFSKHWIKGLSGKLTDNGEPGEVFELIEKSKVIWWN